MMEFFERFSGFIAFIPCWAVAYHFTDSFALVVVICIAYYLLSMFMPAVGVVLQFALWILGAVFVISDQYHIAVIIVYFVFLALYLIRFVRVLKAKDQENK